MAERTSKLWRSRGLNITREIIESGKPTAENLVDVLLAINKDDINYQFMMNIFGNFNGKNLCNPYDLLEVPKGKFFYYTRQDKSGRKENKNNFTTTVGIFIFNIFLRDFNFLRLFNGYYQDTISDKNYGKIEKVLSYALIEDEITTQDLKEFEDTLQWLMPFETILSPNHTEKMVTSSKVIDKKKQELLKKYEKELKAGDPVIAEKIEKELLAFAKEYLGDDPSVDTLDSGALGDWGNNFKNMFIMKGAMRNPDPDAKQKYNIVTGNYIDGIPAEEYSTIAGGATQGAYSRGKKTENGGYYEKLFIAAYNHLILDPPGSDCGTKNHIRVFLTDKNIDDYMYCYAINSNGSLELIDSKSRSKFLNKYVNLRFASMCESKTGICNKCAGELFYKIDNPRVGLVLSSIPDTMKLRSMKGFHDSTIHTVPFDAMKAFYPFEE